MSQIELYRSVLVKLGHLPLNELAALDAYLSRLTAFKHTNITKVGIAHLAGAWKQWDDKDFEDFLNVTRQIREDLFAPRKVDL